VSDHSEEMCNFSSNEHLDDVLARSAQIGISRRTLIRGGLGLAALGSVPFLAACGGGGGDDDVATTETEKALGFSAVGKSIADTVTLPSGLQQQGQ
jgi:uncharacterized protein